MLVSAAATFPLWRSPGWRRKGDARYPDQAAEWLLATEQEAAGCGGMEAGLFHAARTFAATREGFRETRAPGRAHKPKAPEGRRCRILGQGEPFASEDTLSALDAQLHRCADSWRS